MSDRWWMNPWVLAGLCLATALPITFTSIPPLVDLYGHMGRYHIQAEIADNPFIQEHWDFQWALVANLGVDLLSIPLGAMLGLERAIWLIVLAIPPLMAFGFVRVARQAHANVPATAIAALPFALAYPFQFGFVNYWLGAALAFHVFASWLAAAEHGTSASKAYMIFVPAGLIVWVTHVYAWGILGVLAGGSEIGRAWQAGDRNVQGLFWRPLVKTLPLAAPLPLMILWRAEGAGAVTSGWFGLQHKFMGLAFSLRDQSMVIDFVSLALVFALIYAGFRQKTLSFSPLLGVPAMLFFGLAMVFPYKLFGSAYADVRLWPIALAVTVLAIRSAPEAARAARRIAVIAVSVLFVRVAAGTAGFIAYDAAAERHLAALNEVERGSRIAALVQMPCDGPWRWVRLEHMPSIAILRRDAFTNTQWDVPGAQLLRPLAARGTTFNASPSQYVVDHECRPNLQTKMQRRIGEVPRDRFDYVWVLGADPESLTLPADLHRVYADDRTSLYRIDRDTVS